MITQAQLKENFVYDPLTGLFMRTYPNKPPCAVGHKNDKGYISFRALGRGYPAHRLDWLYVHGCFPPDRMDIDHINGDRADNRLINLRIATRQQNSANARKYRTNKSGFKGVSWHITKKKWCAYIKISGKSKYIGAYSTAETAHAAYCEVAKKTFGEYCNFGGNNNV